MKKILRNKLLEITNKLLFNEEKHNIVVMNGFDNKDLEHLENKLLKSPVYIDIDDLENNQTPTAITKELFSKDNKKLYWITYEEFVKTNKYISLYSEIIILNNNLYNKSFPYNNTIKDIEKWYNEFFLKEDKNIKNEYKQKYDLITKYYGDILFSKNSNTYYLVHNTFLFENYKIINLFEENEQLKNNNEKKDIIDKYTIELTEDETIFLDLTKDILNNNLKQSNIEIVVMSDLSDITNKYVERVNIINSLKNNYYKIYFAKKIMESKSIEKLGEYKDILKRYWGYDDFRYLKMYRDIKSESRELIDISQGQIINDIAEQSIIALDSENKNYRDIFITSSTGSGKSIMFQIPAIYLKEKYPDINPLTIVISPLIALMNDQIDNLKSRGINIARTINSNTEGYKRDEILDEVNNGTCSILYLSPETLQSRHDIKQLIGDRRLGLVIVDEAHIVTTWGKSFRADYWYLGIYLQRLRKQYDFPIVTFTATAIYGGREDMYLETRDSLNMLNPISYFGKIRRDDIKMLITSAELNSKKKGNDYRKDKKALALNRIKYFLDEKQKSLIYFPTVRQLNEFYGEIKLNLPEKIDFIGRYYGGLDKEEKNVVLEKFKEGQLLIVLATKAFGMGVDVDNIKNVYHYAPSGSVTDYIQEIGRVARDNKKIQTGFAWCDFLPYDFTEVKRLYGMNRINKFELLSVMDKIIKIYKDKNENRNLLINTEDFRHAFNLKDDDNIVEIDNRIKTALLLIEKDFSSPTNLGFAPFVARPRGVFGKDMILVDKAKLQLLNKSILKKYINFKYKLSNGNYDYVYTIDLDKLWEDRYRHLSFPNFKRMINDKNEFKSLDNVNGNIFNELIYTTGVRINALDRNQQAEVISEYNSFIKILDDFLTTHKRKEKQFSLDDLGYYLISKTKVDDFIKARSIAQTMISACFEYQKLKDIKIIKERINQNDIKYILLSSYSAFIDFAKDRFEKFIKNKVRYVTDYNNIIKFYVRGDYSEISYDVITLSIAESLELTTYSIENGNTPQIFLRINSTNPLETAIKKGTRYENHLLNKTNEKHYISIEMLTYLFKYKSEGNTTQEKVENYTNFFWNTIEDYFLGIIPKEVEEALSKTNKKDLVN